jgi:Fe-S-cluster containining protein
VIGPFQSISKLETRHEICPMTIPQTIQERSKATAPFQCQLCGECCTSWQIPIEAQKAETLFQKKWVQKQLADHQLAFEALSPDHYRVPLKSDGYCVFLGEENRCLIEVHEGYEAKPEQCKRFPFARTEMQDSNIPDSEHDVVPATEASGFCKAIAEQYWPKGLTVIPGERDRSFDGEVLPPSINLRKPGFWQKSPAQATRHFFETLEQALQRFETTPVASLGDLEKTLKQLAHHWIYDKSDPTEFTPFSKQTHRLMTALFLRHPHGWVSAESLWNHRIYLDYKLFGMPLDLEKHPDVKPPNDPEALQPLQFFFSQFLRRKVPYTYGHTGESMMCAALVSYFMVIWYAKTNAMLQERDQVLSEDVILAIRTTERYYTGHQPEFLDQFRTSLWTPFLRQWLLN